MELVQSVSQWFWNESFWFPVGFRWSDIESTPTESYPSTHDLRFSLYYAVLLYFIRCGWEWLIARPIGSHICGIEDTHSELHTLVQRVRNFFQGTCSVVQSPTDAPSLSPSTPESDGLVVNGHLPSANGDGKITDRRTSECSTSTSSSIKRKKKLKEKLKLIAKKSTLDKFAESSWRMLFYSFIFCWGVSNLRDKTWFWETQSCWYGWPYQTIPRQIWHYYMIEAGFYWSLAFSQFIDVQRKDFWVNFVHHIVTIMLISLSWCVNFARAGCLILVIHDAADAFMEAAKMARYAKKDTFCNIFFVMFTVMWFVTRLYLYPKKVIYTTAVESISLVGWCGAYYIFNSLLVLLLILHIFWSIMILRIAVNAVMNGETNDVRSDDEGEEDDENAVSDNELRAILADLDPETRTEIETEVAMMMSNGAAAAVGGASAGLPAFPRANTNGSASHTGKENGHTTHASAETGHVTNGDVCKDGKLKTN